MALRDSQLKLRADQMKCSKKSNLGVIGREVDSKSIDSKRVGTCPTICCLRIIVNTKGVSVFHLGTKCSKVG